MARKLLLALWVVLIGTVVVISLMPAGSPTMAAVNRLHVPDFVEHVTAYMALAFLAAVLIRPRRRGRLAAGAMFLMGLALEIAQLASPGREFEVVDLAANAVGVAVGIWVAGRFD